MRDHTQRQVIRFDFAFHGELADLGHQTVMAADHATEHTLVRQMVGAPFDAVTRPAAEEQREILWRAGFEKSLFQCEYQFHRHAVTAETGTAQRIAIANDGDRLGGGDDFLFHSGLHRLKSRSDSRISPPP